MSYCSTCQTNHSMIGSQVIEPQSINYLDPLQDLVYKYMVDMLSEIERMNMFAREYSINESQLPAIALREHIMSKLAFIDSRIYVERKRIIKCMDYRYIYVVDIFNKYSEKLREIKENIELFIQRFTLFSYNFTSKEVPDYLHYRPLLKTARIYKKDLEKIEDLECKICYDTTDINKRCVLNCNHTLCIDCVSEHIDAADEKQLYSANRITKYYSCPYCRSNIVEISANYVISRSKKVDKYECFNKNDLISSNSYNVLKTKCVISSK